MYTQINVKGGDANTFLQGQLTQDIDMLSTNPSLLAAWCNPKGRVVTLVRLLRLENSIGLVVPTEMVDIVLNKLQMYRLRADVEFEVSGEEWSTVAIHRPEDLQRLTAANLVSEVARVTAKSGLIAVSHLTDEPFTELFGLRTAYADSSLEFSAPMNDAERAGARLRACIPEIGKSTSEKFTPHMLNLDKLGAISFSKGCYTGQEVVARTENLGKSKRSLKHYRCSEKVPEIGDKLLDGENTVGEVINTAGEDFLAVTAVAAQNKPLTIRGAVALPV